MKTSLEMDTSLDEILTTCLKSLHTSLAKKVENLIKREVEDLQLELAELLKQASHQISLQSSSPDKFAELGHESTVNTTRSTDGKHVSYEFKKPCDELSRTESSEVVSYATNNFSIYGEAAPEPTEAKHETLNLKELSGKSLNSRVTVRDRLTAFLPFGTKSNASGSGSHGIPVGWITSDFKWRSDCEGRQDYVSFMVNHRAFESVFSVIILINCGLLGIQAHGQVTDHYSGTIVTMLQVSEHIFSAIFAVELLMRIHAYGLRGFNPCVAGNRWNVFDGLLVLVAGIFVGYILPIVAMLFKTESDSSVVRTFTVLRAIRLLRIARVLQRSPFFHEAWLLIRGLSDSLRTLFWTCVVIFLITYVFAVFGLVMISLELKKVRDESDDPFVKEQIDTIMTSVGGLDVLMATLIQLLTMDSWNAKVELMKVYVWYSWIYFYSYIAVAVFVLMNLVTAIIVENAVTNSRLDEDQSLRQKERAKRAELKELEQLFNNMDTDGNGKLSWEEFKDAFNDPSMVKKWKLLDFDPEECREVFALLDDGDGEIETNEFFDGLGRMKGVAQSKDIFKLLKQLDRHRDDILDLIAASHHEDASDCVSERTKHRRHKAKRSKKLHKKISPISTGDDSGMSSNSPGTSRDHSLAGKESPRAPIDTAGNDCAVSSSCAQRRDDKVDHLSVAPTPLALIRDPPALPIEVACAHDFKNAVNPPAFLSKGMRLDDLCLYNEPPLSAPTSHAKLKAGSALKKI